MLVRQTMVLLASIAVLDSGAAAQSSVTCPMNGKEVLSGKGVVTGRYRLNRAATLYVEGNSSAFLGPRGTLSAKLTVDDLTSESATDNSSQNQDKTMSVRTSTSIAAQAGATVIIRLQSTNSNGNTIVDAVKLSCD